MGSPSGVVGELKRVRASRTPRPAHAPSAAWKASPSVPGIAPSMALDSTPTLITEDRRNPDSDAVRSLKPVECGQEPTCLRQFSNHLLGSQEQEREAVARELHDDIGQRLSLVEILLSEVDPSQTDTATEKRLQAARSHIQNANDTIRQISHRSYPAILKDLGLPAALNSLVLDFEQKQGMAIRFVCRNIGNAGLKHAALAIYRIAEEALKNAAKHAGETVVDVALEQQGRILQLRVVDRGKGFNHSIMDDRPC